MTIRKKRGPAPDPNSANRQGLARLARIVEIADGLARLIPLASLPEMFPRFIVEDKIPATESDADLRRRGATLFLHRSGFVALGSHNWQHKTFAVWARPNCPHRALRQRDRAKLIFDPPDPEPPKRSLSFWRAEYKLLHANMVGNGFTGRPMRFGARPPGGSPRPQHRRKRHAP